MEQEKSAAFTVSYTAALAVMAQIAIELGLMGMFLAPAERVLSWSACPHSCKGCWTVNKRLQS